MKGFISFSRCHCGSSVGLSGSAGNQIDSPVFVSVMICGPGTWNTGLLPIIGPLEGGAWLLALTDLLLAVPWRRSFFLLRAGGLLAC